METNNTENANSQISEETASEIAGQSETTEETVPLSKFKEVEESNRQLFERAKKAEGFVKVDGKWVKAPKAEEAIAAIHKAEAATGELTETQLDYLDLKGITNEDDIAIIQRVMQRSGLTVRQALADDYVQSKLEANKKARDVQAAVPTSTKRSGSAMSNDVDYWVQRNAQTGEWPSDFALRAKVVEAKERKFGSNAPAWLS